MFLIQKEKILQEFYCFNIMKVIVVKCLPLQNAEGEKEGKKENHEVIS